MTVRAAQQFPCALGSPREARRFCASNLVRTLGDDARARCIIEDAQMIVSELLTNAVNAHCKGAELTVTVHDGVIRIEVHDDGEGLPELRKPDVADEHGRGLLIVSALASDWGFEPSSRGKLVWAELRVA